VVVHWEPIGNVTKCRYLTLNRRTNHRENVVLLRADVGTAAYTVGRRQHLVYFVRSIREGSRVGHFQRPVRQFRRQSVQYVKLLYFVRVFQCHSGHQFDQGIIYPVPQEGVSPLQLCWHPSNTGPPPPLRVLRVLVPLIGFMLFSA